jgi:flavodoxin
MKTALLYGTTHGRTRKVVEESLRRLSVKPEVFDVKTLPAGEQFAVYDLLLFFSPTYGDGELQPDMEEFIRRFSLDLTGKYFVICELGGYIGYETFSFGAADILSRFLIKQGARELCPPLSLDSLPRVHWPHLYHWIEYVNRSCNGYARL